MFSKHAVFILIFLIIANTLIFSQPTKPSELELLYMQLEKKDLPRLEKINVIEQLVEEFHDILFEETANLSMEGGKLSKKEKKYKQEFAFCLYEINARIMLHDFERVEECFERIDRLKDKISNKNLLAEMNISYGDYSISKKYPSDAVNYYGLSLDILHEINDQNRVSQILNKLGNTHIIWNDYPEASNFYKKALFSYQERNDIQGQLETFNRLGDLHILKKEFKAAKDYFKRTIDLSENTEFFDERVYGLEKYIEILEDVYKDKKESKKFKRDFEIAQANRDVTQSLVYYDVYKAVGKDHEAIGYFKIHTSAKEKLDNLKHEKEIIKIEKKVQQKEVETKKLKKQKVVQQQEIIEVLEENVSKEEEISYLKETQKIKELELENSKLESKNKELEIVRQKSIQKYLVSLSLVILLVLLMIINRYRYRRRAHKNMITLSEIGKDMTSSLSIDDILSIFLKNISRLVSVDLLGIGIYHEGDNKIEQKLYIEKGEQIPLEYISMDDDSSIAVKCIKQKEIIIIDDFEKQKSSIFISEEDYPESNFLSMAYLPLILKEKILGYLTVKRYKRFKFTPYILNTLKTLTSYLTIALDNAGIYEQINSLNKDLIEKNQIIKSEMEKSEKLLLNILPVRVANDLKENGKSIPESFDDVTVFISDIVGFTKMSAHIEPKVLISELNEIFTAFDNIFEHNNCERIKTIGDAYLAVCGLPNPNQKHAENILKSSLEIREYLIKRNKISKIQWLVRTGIHSGSVVAGIVGVKKYIYDVFGDTINTASRLEENCEPMKINVSETTYKQTKKDFAFMQRTSLTVKGKGKMKMYYVDTLS